MINKMKLWGLLFSMWAPVVFAEQLDVTIHYVGPTEGSVWMGLQQGVDEANHMGEFLGQHYTVKPVSIDEVEQLQSVSSLLVASTDVEKVLAVAQLPQLTNVPVMNLLSDADQLRLACQANLLNMPASQKMKQDALAQWLAKHPDTPVKAQGWHEKFKKFAASQLNIRYSKAHGVKMDDDAWAGWAAAKLISDTVARTQSTDAAVLLDYMKNDIAFDSQKGEGASFRETGQLRQLVLLIDENNKIAAEAPLRGVKGGLDSLGYTTCKQ